MENNKNQKITTPTAIIVAGFLVMLAIIITSGGPSLGSNKSDGEKTLSEQVGVKKEQFKKCLDETNLQDLKTKTDDSANLAMKGVPVEERGTPYSVIIGKNGSKTEVRGAYSIDELRKLVEEVSSGKVTTPYTGEVPPITAEDHIIGSTDAPIVIIEYSDLECPFCKRFGGVMKQLVEESNGQVAWVYRHWVVHQTALPKTAAAECVAKLKGNEAFWKYVDLVFGLMKTEEDTANTSNL